MTSSSHVLLISDEDNVRNRKTSTSSSLDSWDGLGLGDEAIPQVSRTRALANQDRTSQQVCTQLSAAAGGGEYSKAVLVQRNVQSHKNAPRYVQQNVKRDSENHRSQDSSKSHVNRSTMKKSPTDKMIWYSGPPTQDPPDISIGRDSVQSVKPMPKYVSASHLSKAERVSRTPLSTTTENGSNLLQQGGKGSSSSDSKFPQKPSQTSPVDSTEKMKIRLMSVWNNVKYGWAVRTKTSFNCSSPIFLLGQMYREHHMGEYHRHQGESSYEKFLLDFSSRVWLTYRRDFPLLEGSTLTTDCGWGCMLRSGQMMLAQALQTHFLDRGWRLNGVPQTEKSECLHRMIIRWFGDTPSELCPFSIHHLVDMARSMGKKAGDWFGPASVAYLLKQAMEAASYGNPPLDELCVYIAQDCTVYKQDVIELCTRPSRIQKIQDYNVIRNSPLLPPHRQKGPIFFNHSRVETIEWKDVLDDQNDDNLRSNTPPNLYRYRDYQSPPKSPLSRTWSNPFIATMSEKLSPLPSMGQSSFPSGTSLDCIDEPRGDKWRSLVVLIPVRLGGERLNKIYFPCINQLLAHECSIGIIGGRPRHSLYFVGFQDDKLINLDPHYCQEMVDVRVPSFPLESFQCSDPRKIPITKMDPSCTIGFYFRTREDFEKFTETVEPLLSSGESKSDYPIFIISSESSSTSVHHPTGSEFRDTVDGHDMETNSDGEDYVLL